MMDDHSWQPLRRGRWFEEFHAGERFRSAGRTITDADLVLFSGLVGAQNPQFLDEEYARASPFGGRIAPGPLTLALGLVAAEPLLTGTLLALLGVDRVRYQAPVRPGDTVYAEIEVAEVRPSSQPGRGIVRLASTLRNQRGEAVLTFEHTLLVRARAG